MDIDLKKAQIQYNRQKNSAKQRGIGWKLTFHEWVQWWGSDWHRRGRGHDKLQMQRFHDRGAYEIGNITKGHPRENSKTMGNVRRNRNSAALLDRHREVCAISNRDAELCDEDGVDEDELEILAMTGYQTSERMWGYFRRDK